MKWLLLVIMLSHTPLVFAGDVSILLAGFKGVTESNVKFVESWSAEYLDEAVVSKGILSYKFPGMLTKIIEQPEYAEQQIKGDQLTVIRQGKTHVIQLSEQPVLAAGVYALRDVLEGNEASLLKRFTIKFEANDESWMIVLLPKHEKVIKRIAQLVLRGEHNRITHVTIHYQNGDSMHTEILHDG